MFKEAQEQVADYDRRSGWTGDSAGHIVLHLQEELGEIARRVLRDVGYKNESFSKEELADEIADIQYLLLKLANHYDIKLDDAWNRMWERYESKTNRK